MGKIKEADYFRCSYVSCDTHDMTGRPACEFCHRYLDCVYCGYKNTSFCENCLIRDLREGFDNECENKTK